MTIATESGHQPQVAKNTLLNIVGQGAPAFLGLVTVPIMVRGLGVPAFGAYSLAWVVLGYLSLVDLGLGRATTYSVADALARGTDDSIRGLVSSSLRTQAILGVGGSLLLAALVPWLVDHLFQVAPTLQSTVRAGLYFLAASLPVTLLSASLSGVLEAHRRFDILNAIRTPTSLAVLGLPAATVLLGGGFLGAVLALITARVFGTVALSIAANQLLPPSTAGRHVPPTQSIKQLLGFGGWITVSNIVSPLMVYSDRFVIGSQIGLSAVAHYSAPFDVVTRLSLIPSSLVSVLFPEFTRSSAALNVASPERLILRSTRALLFSLGLLVVVSIPLIPLGLTLWLGADFAAASTWPARLLLLGVLINSIAWVPLAYLQGSGHPHVTARIHLVELPAYLIMLWTLTSAWGITGTALAWLVRVALDTTILFYVSARTGGVRSSEVLRAIGPGVLLVGLALLSGTLVSWVTPWAAAAPLNASVAALVFIFGVTFLLAPDEQTLIMGLWHRLQRRGSRKT